jgi:signal transduction histidine kinase
MVRCSVLANTPKPSAERNRTDDSLRDERAKSDRAISEGREQVTDVADDVLRRARVNADAVLLNARAKADQLTDQTQRSQAAVLAVEQARKVEDAVLRDDRATADETLDFERVETLRLLNRLLPDERNLTDGRLQAERVRSDGAVANRDDFLGLVAHDLRDLLGGIAMSTAVLVKVAPADPAGQVGLEVARIQRHVARAHRLIGDLVDVASIDAGRLSIVPAPGDLSALLVEIADEFRASAASKGIELRIDNSQGKVAGDFDHARLFQVCSNLVGNAIKFSPRGTTITLRSERAGDQLKCSVSDQGPGIPAQRIDSVFERFAQVQENDRRGLGLGLFIARQIVEGHGGRMWAESTLGHGTSVLFTIPISAR